MSHPADDVREKLELFRGLNAFTDRSAACVALLVTRRFAQRRETSPHAYLAARGTQVAGLGAGAINQVLASHGVDLRLGGEAGRTSAGSVGRMQDYLRFMSEWPRETDWSAVERFWIEQIQRTSSRTKLRMRWDETCSLRFGFMAFFAEISGRKFDPLRRRRLNQVLQHLVGAKLDLVLGEGEVTHHPVAEADQAEGRAGDFTAGDAAIHVTTHPGEAVIARCLDNLAHGLRPILITPANRAAAADALADAAGIAQRVEVVEIEQFLASNLHEWSRFQKTSLRPRVAELFTRYNTLIDTHEHDPSLRIELA